MKIKLLPLDKLFSRFIRLRANGVCERCGKPTPFERLQCSHFHGRRKKSVRWNEDNACALCFHCHQHLGENPLEHTEWYRKKIGNEKFVLLEIQAGQIVKPNQVLVKLYLEQKLAEIIAEGKCG